MALHARFRNSDRHLFPQLERTPDLNRGDIRFAAEVVLAEFCLTDVPIYAHQRAIDTLAVLAKG